MTLREILQAQSQQNSRPTDPFCGQVSLFDSAFDSEPSDSPRLGTLLDMIQDGEWADEVNRVRQVLARGNRKAYDDAKRQLPAFCMSALVSTRDKAVPVADRIQQHSGILQADFDRKDNGQLQDLVEIAQLLQDDSHVVFGFISPSGEGIKCGVRIDGSRHLESFQAAEAYFLKNYALQIDRSTKDPVRLCFVSHDANLWRNPEAEILPIPNKSKVRNVETWHPPLENTAEDIREMLGFIPNRPDYDTWLRIASAVWSALPLEQGTRLLIEWSPEEKVGEYAKKWPHRLTEVHVGTLAWYASQHGFDARAAARRKRWAGRIRFAADNRNGGETEDLGIEPQEVAAVEVSREIVWDCLERMQRGDAELWAITMRGHLVYDHYAECWRRYKDGLWERDDLHQVRIDYIDTLTRAYRGLKDSIIDDIARTPAPDGEKDARFKQLAKADSRIARLSMAGYANGGLDLSQSLPGMAVRATAFDKAPYLLALKNGVIDFEKGEKREFRPKDMLTVRSPIAYDPDATCPEFDAFLEFFLDGNQDVISFLWRAIGYSLTGWVDKDVLFFCYGKGANGKSTFNNVLRMLLGELMTVIDVGTLLDKRSDANLDYKKSMLEGRRAVVTDEIPENKRLNESMVKTLIGGEEIVARRPYERPYTFEPTHKVWMVGNHKPTITGTDLGIWRRILLIPFLVTISEEKRRARHEVLAEFRAELAGILNRALKGFEEMRKMNGLKPPKEVLEATAQYRQDSDQLASFLEERTQKDSANEIKATALLKAYLAWCEDNGELPLYRSSKKLVNHLRERGFHIEIGHARSRVIVGIRLTPTAPLGEHGEEQTGTFAEFNNEG
ncbi:MAG: phage/plasmid primase, P4 family [Opitutaceae bacterium]